LGVGGQAVRPFPSLFAPKQPAYWLSAGSEPF
jgi:hypothetical protein